MDPWIVTPVERARHVEQFKALGPTGGYITGDQARGFLLQSSLPPPILAQIWGLADVDCDGKLDINEFSVACKLVTMKLKGMEIPPALPPALRGIMSASGTTTPILSPQLVGIGMINPPTGILSPPLQSGIRPNMPVGMINPPMQPLAASGVNFAQPGAVPLQMPPVHTGMVMGSVPSTGNSVPPSSLAFRSANPPVSGATVHSQDSLRRSTSITSHDALSSPLLEWAVPNPSRLKYTQLFNQNDRSKSGYLTGVQARNILLGTGLPQPILAQVWYLSDMDSDGRLGTEEFILALHLCDVARQTGRLPPKLTPDLIPPSFRSGSRKQSIKSIPGSIVGSGQNTGSNSPVIECELVLSPGGTTFEDKRKENFDKGQAELERRRKVLQDMQDRERHERERKEREEYERQEKQRLEIERRQTEERERQLSMQREMEERRIEEMRKKEEEKDVARREMERQRKMEMEGNKRQDLLARRQKEQEEVLRLKGVNHGLGLELSQLTDKVKELSSKITETRQGVSTVKTEIDGMRTNRDTFMNDMGLLKSQLKDQNNRMLLAAQEKVRLEKLATESEAKQMNLKQLREKLQNMRDELEKKQSDSDISVNECNELKTTLSALIEGCKTIYDEYKQKRETVITNRKKHAQELDYNAAWGDTGKVVSRQGSLITNGDGPSYYRAVYDFEGRNEDELSFTAGDIIQKNDSVVPDPGWLAGIFGGKSGWFPESFVEFISADEAEIPTAAVTIIPTQKSVDGGGAELAGDYYVAVYPYESTEPGDLPFEVGEMILVTHKEGEWWTGQVGADRVGIFPANYVSLQDGQAAVHETPANENYSSAKVVSSNFAESSDNVDANSERRTELEPFDEAEIKREISEIVKQPLPKSPKTTKSRRYEIATVLANYQGTSEGQLNLTRGQLITVRKKSPSGWWEGEVQLKGKQRTIGWFPGSYVKVLGPGGGSRQSSSRTTPIPFDEYEMPITSAPVYSDSKEQVIALYPYTAQNNDELTFIKDDVITVISKDEPDWWRGQIGSSVGLFPTNYVQPMSNTQGQDIESFGFPDEFGEKKSSRDNNTATASGPWGNGDFFSSGQSRSKFDISFDNEPVVVNNTMKSISSTSSGSDESKRQDSILELIVTESKYMTDMQIVKECFMVPLSNSGLLTSDEILSIFVNWDDLIDCSNRLVKAFIIRQRTCYNGSIQMIGDILCQHIPSFIIYIRFCSAQLRSAALLQQKCESSTEFRDFCKSCQANPNTNSLPLSSFLIKPMQRITKYPLLVKKIIEYTPDTHPDRQNLEEALIKAEELCLQVNEGVREKENSDRLEWMQTHINCDGLEERVIFNSLTNALGPRKFLHHGILHKTKSGKQLVGFLFNDFLLLAQPNKILNQNSFSFDRHKTLKFKIYRKPLFLNELILEETVSDNENEFVIGMESNKPSSMYILAPGVSEKRLWLKNIRDAKKCYIQTELQYLQRQKSKKGAKAVGRLLVVVMEGENLADRDKSVRQRRAKGKLKVVVVRGKSLANRDSNGKSDPYCEVSLGSEIKRTRVICGSLNPKWNDSMQFSVKDLKQDILCLTVHDKDYFSPNQFLGRTEIGISTIHEETKNRKTPWTKKFPLHEVESGEIVIKLHLQLFEN